ncbi:hypothetical protein CW304_04675 [Bacillus sp. UFRGS-B20]|nr:hypothetical protein CW304_04675 [Bacillus sp. UFRGS-B20]
MLLFQETSPLCFYCRYSSIKNLMNVFLLFYVRRFYLWFLSLLLYCLNSFYINFQNFYAKNKNVLA